LFEAALALEASQRATFPNEACAGAIGSRRKIGEETTVWASDASGVQSEKGATSLPSTRSKNRVSCV